MHSWRVLLLPFVESPDLYEQYDLEQPWDSPHNKKLISKRPSIYAFHKGASDDGSTNYLAVVGPETTWPGATSTAREDNKDGLSDTIFIVENHGSNIPWTAPQDLELSKMNLSVADNAKDGVSSVYTPAVVLFGDGMSRTFSAEIEPAALRAMFTIDGGEVVQDGKVTRIIEDGRDRPLRDDIDAPSKEKEPQE